MHVYVECTAWPTAGPPTEASLCFRWEISQVSTLLKFSLFGVQINIFQNIFPIIERTWHGQEEARLCRRPVGDSPSTVMIRSDAYVTQSLAAS
jgi:hypothetical protein